MPGQPVWDGRQWVRPAPTATQQWGAMPPTQPQYFGGGVQPAPITTQRWGAVPGYNSQFAGFGPPARKSSGAKTCLTIIIGAAVALLLITVLVTLYTNAKPDPPTPPYTTVPSVTTATQPTQPTQTNTNQGDGNYVNDGYVVPAPGTNAGRDRPTPLTWTEATDMLQRNELYNNVMMPVPVRCELPEVNLFNANSAALKSYFDEFTVCLMRAWDPTLREAGFYAVRPVINIYSSEIETPCGTVPMQNAAFCAANEQVYYATDLPSILPAEVRGKRMVIEAVIAHEFGHAVQNRTGILLSGNAWQEYYASQNDQPKANQISRQMELQADCFAGEFLNSIQQSVGLTQDEADAVTLLFYSIGDDILTGDSNYDGNHGRGQNRVNWLAQGFNQQNLGVCNTFVVEGSDTK